MSTDRTTNPDPGSLPKPMTIRQFAQWSGMGLKSAYRYAKAGLLPGVIRVGRRIFVNPAAFLAVASTSNGVQA